MPRNGVTCVDVAENGDRRLEGEDIVKKFLCG
jgi:hypothetical protein